MPGAAADVKAACAASSLPVDVAAEEQMFATRQRLDIWDQVAVVVHVQKQLTGGAVVLGLAVAVAHGEANRAAVGSHLKSQQSVLQLDAFDGGDDADEVAPRQGLFQQRTL